uniref:Uncharacterized protein n=1 Tax=Arundo donax TaxID=35708 RepID=A0A0A9FIR3_ARUDO
MTINVFLKETLRPCSLTWTFNNAHRNGTTERIRPM